MQSQAPRQPPACRANYGGSPERRARGALRVEQRGPARVFDHCARARPIVDWSRLGFILADAPKLERNFAIGDVQQRSFDDTWEQPWGERRYVRNHGNEMRVTLREKVRPRADRRVPRVR